MKYNFDKVIDRTGTNCLKWDACKDVFGKDDILPMWVADTDFEAPKEAIDAMKKRLEHGIFGYTYRSESFNNAVISWMKKRHGWDIEDEWITFSPGIVPAISIAVNTFTHPGDKVIVQTPIYPPFQSVVEKIDNEFMFLDGRYYMDIDKLEEQISLKDLSYTNNTTNENRDFDDRVKLLLLCNPHNPSGRVWTKEELLRIGEICLKNNIIIVSDEIHSDIIYKGHKHIPIASLSKELEQNTITCIAPSKTFSLAGLSTSAIIIPNKEIRSMFNNTLGTLEVDGGNIFGTIALEAAYNHGEEWLEELLTYLEGNLDYLMKYFEDRIPRIKPVRPDASYLIWLDCSEEGVEGKELVDFLVNEAKVGVNPGFKFGESGRTFVRLNIGCPRSTLEEGLRRIEEAVKKFSEK